MWDATGTLSSGDFTYSFSLWDVGTAKNPDPSQSSNYPWMQMPKNSNETDLDPNVRQVNKGYVNPEIKGLIQVTLTPIEFEEFPPDLNCI